MFSEPGQPLPPTPLSALPGTAPDSPPPLATPAAPTTPDLHASLQTDHSEAVLLAAIADCEFDAAQVATRFNIRLDLFLDWFSAPQTITRLGALLTSREMVRLKRYQSMQDAALTALQNLHIKAEKDGDAVECRRSATAVARLSCRATLHSPARLLTGLIAPAAAAAHRAQSTLRGGISLSRFPQHFRTRSRIIRTTPILHEPPAILPPPPESADPELSPSRNTLRILHRLQDSDNPAPGDGLRILFNHFTARWRERVGAATANEFTCTPFTGYHRLIGHHSAVLRPTDYEFMPDRHKHLGANHKPEIAYQHFEFTSLDGHLSVGLFTFHRAALDAPWLIDSVAINSAELGAADPPSPPEPSRPPPTPAPPKPAPR